MANVVTDPYSGLQFVELSHVWDHGVPSYPGDPDVRMVRGVKHAQHGVLAWRITTVLNTGTHMNAPLAYIQQGADLASVDPSTFFGNGVVLDVPKKNWEQITADDLKAAEPAIEKDDIVVICTGWNAKYSDGLEYFGEAPGLTKDAAEYLVEAGVKMVAVDTPFVDCPLATHMGPHRGGPQMKRLAAAYADATGGDAKKDFPDLNIVARTLLGAGIPIVKQVGGDVESVKGRRATLGAIPWKFEHGEACPVRMIAIFDPTGNARIEPGSKDGRKGLTVHSLGHTFTQFMPEWPSTPSVNIDVVKFHARDGVYQTQWEGIMHRCTHMDAPLHVTECTPTINDYPIWRMFGTGVVVDAPKEKWGVISAEDLENATPKIQEGDMVMINTGFHRKWADTDEYFAYGPGADSTAAQWAIDHKIKCVGYGCQANDHPIATKLVNHGLGPTHPHLIEEWKQEHGGQDPLEAFPDWEPAHKTLMVKGGIPGIENVGGDLDEVTGERCTLLVLPWRWPSGDGCIVQILAIVDPEQEFRFAPGL